MGEPVPAEEAAQRLPEIVEAVAQRRERVRIRTRDGVEVVIMSAADLESLEETLELLNDPEAMAELSDALAAMASGHTERLEDLYPRGV